MTAPITDESYTEQLRRAFDAFKFASPQQLAMTAQAVQGNPQSPEALALATANNFQQQQRAAAAQAPQQTVYQQQIGKLLASLQPPPQANPMQGGITGIGGNQYALQEAAAQDPMRNAGIGAAPENMPQQGAATGGLVALAHGGEVRGFSGVDGSYADLAIPELGTTRYPEESEEEEGADERDADASYNDPSELAENRQLALNEPPLERTGPVKVKTPRQDNPDVHKPAPGSSAEQIHKKSQKDILASSAQELMDLYGPSYAMSPELEEKFAGQLKDANRDKWINAMAQGIGGMLSAQTPYASQAFGQGLLSGAAGYQQGSKEEADLNKQMLALRLAAEKEHHADKRSAISSVYKTKADAEKLKAQQQFGWNKLGATLQGMKEIAGLKQQGKNLTSDKDRAQLITDIFGKLQANQKNKIDSTLIGLDDRALMQRATQMADAMLPPSSRRSSGIDSDTMNAINLMGTLGPTGIFGD